MGQFFPSEVLSTDNLMAIFELLPCRYEAGIASLLKPDDVAATPFASIAVQSSLLQKEAMVTKNGGGDGVGGVESKLAHNIYDCDKFLEGKKNLKCVEKYAMQSSIKLTIAYVATSLTKLRKVPLLKRIQNSFRENIRENVIAGCIDDFSHRNRSCNILLKLSNKCNAGEYPTLQVPRETSLETSEIKSWNKQDEIPQI